VRKRGTLLGTALAGAVLWLGLITSPAVAADCAGQSIEACKCGDKMVVSYSIDAGQGGMDADTSHPDGSGGTTSVSSGGANSAEHTVSPPSGSTTVTATVSAPGPPKCGGTATFTLDDVEECDDCD